ARRQLVEERRKVAVIVHDEDRGLWRGRHWLAWLGADAEGVLIVTHVYVHARSRFDLPPRHKRGERLGELTVHGALQFSGAVLLTGTLAQQKLATLRRDLEREAALPKARVHVPLQLVDVLVKDRAERLDVERLIGHHGVDPINELWRDRKSTRLNSSHQII